MTLVARVERAKAMSTLATDQTYNHRLLAGPMAEVSSEAKSLASVMRRRTIGSIAWDATYMDGKNT